MGREVERQRERERNRIKRDKKRETILNFIDIRIIESERHIERERGRGEESGGRGILFQRPTSIRRSAFTFISVDQIVAFSRVLTRITLTLDDFHTAVSACSSPTCNAIILSINRRKSIYI